MGQALATPPPPAEAPTKGILKAPPAPVVIAVNAQQNQKKIVSFNPSTKFQGTPSFYHSQLGIQCYISLEPIADSIDPSSNMDWNNYNVKLTLDQSNLAHCFSNITNHIWMTDLLRLHRLSLASAVNPASIPICFALTGLLCPNVKHGAHTCSSASEKIHIKVPAYAAHDVQLTIFDIINPTPTNGVSEIEKYWCLPHLQLQVEWGSTSPRQLIQWMLEQKRYLFCVTMMFDLIYSVRQNPDTVFTVIDL